MNHRWRAGCLSLRDQVWTSQRWWDKKRQENNLQEKGTNFLIQQTYSPSQCTSHLQTPIYYTQAQPPNLHLEKNDEDTQEKMCQDQESWGESIKLLKINKWTNCTAPHFVTVSRNKLSLNLLSPLLGQPRRVPPGEFSAQIHKTAPKFSRRPSWRCNGGGGQVVVCCLRTSW